MPSEKINYPSNLTSKQVKEQILQILSDTIEKLNQEAIIPKLEFVKPFLKHHAHSHKEYKSSSEAKRAAKESCAAAIKEAANMIKTQIFNTVTYYENYLAPDGRLNTLRNELFNAYNQIKELSSQVIKNHENMPPFNIELKTSRETAGQFKNLFKGGANYYNYAKYFSTESFPSPEHYLTSYAANMYIESDYRTEYYQGWSGAKTKEVKYYTWEIEGAIDDIEDDSPERYDYRVNSLREKCLELYGGYINSYIEQMQILGNAFIEKIDRAIAKQEINNANNAQSQMPVKIIPLELYEQQESGDIDNSFPQFPEKIIHLELYE